jgi:transposase
MSEPQQPAAREPEFAAFVALDWADREHAWSLEAPGMKRERGKLQQTPEAIAAWAAGLALRFGGRPIAVALEQSRGALVCALSPFAHLVLYPIHPSTSSRYRAALFPSGSKNDPQDADLLLDLLLQQRARLRPLRPDTEATRKLQGMVEKRRQLVDQRTAHTNRITDLLKVYFPQALDWWDDLASPLAQAALERWPTLAQLQAENPEELRRFLRGRGCRRERIEERLREIPQARSAVEDPAVVEPMEFMVATLLQVVAVLRPRIAQLERKIAEVFAAHPDASLFDALPGAGPVLAPRLLAAFGSRRDRFPAVGDVETYSGIAPVIVRSGRTQYWVHFRWACPKFLRQTFHEFAECSIPQCQWARQFYRTQRDNKKEHDAAVRALAFKWIRILFRCWQSRQPYREEVFVAAQRRRATRPQAGPKRTPAVVPAAAPAVLPVAAPAVVPAAAPACGKAADFELKHVREVLKNLMAGA